MATMVYYGTRSYYAATAATASSDDPAWDADDTYVVVVSSRSHDSFATSEGYQGEWEPPPDPLPGDFVWADWLAAWRADAKKRAAEVELNERRVEAGRLRRTREKGVTGKAGTRHPRRPILLNYG